MSLLILIFEFLMVVIAAAAGILINVVRGRRA